MGKDFQTSMQLFTSLYEKVPYFSEVFDEESFYLFAILFAAFTVLVVVVLSRYITLKEADW